MKTINIDQNSPEWLELRRSKITGSKLKDLVAKRGGRKIGFYQLIADKLALVDEVVEDPRERGHRLEEEALEHASQELNLEITNNCGMWVSDFNDNIAVSPDGAVEIDGNYPIAFGVKCLGAARHLQIVIEKQVPDDFHLQIVQYFLVNEKLEELYFVAYNPNVVARPLHIIEVSREEVQDEVDYYTKYETDLLTEIDAIVEELAF